MGGLWLQATLFDTLYYMEAEAMCQKWPRMVHVGMENVCILIKCNARWDFVGLRVGYIRAYYSRQEQRQPLTRYCLYLPASMDKHGRTRKTRKIGS